MTRVLLFIGLTNYYHATHGKSYDPVAYELSRATKNFVGSFSSMAAELGHTSLLDFTQKLYDELLQERQNRSIYQIERDQLQIFWDITKKNLVSLASDMNLMQNIAEENFQKIDKVEKKNRQQRLQLIYEHNINLNKVQSENTQILKCIALDCDQQITDLFNINTSLKEKILQNNIQHTNQIKTLKIKHIEALKDKTKWMECQMSQIMDRIEKQRNYIIEKITKKNEIELAQIENIKEKQIKLLLEQHKNEFEDMHTFYQEITISNQSLISCLKRK
ncbi:dynein regulatory complex subunit 4-like, partial [Daktulosphaira vitifoliae]|uniref:dynein regulatory complex subunit 4-like n=1 Tax=Daktulosphaira vitifoliae TaxID=58002 RepID=UPI0021A985E3